MLNRMKNDEIFSFLVERCMLTEAQLDTLIISRMEGTLRQKTSLRDRRRVSEGSFIRTLRQGQENVEKCLYTLILLEYLQVVSVEQIQGFARLGGLFSKVKDSSPSSEEVDRLTVALTDFISRFS